MIQLLIVAVVGGLWATLWSFFGRRIRPVSDETDRSDS
jgi:hypothetical protein